MSNLLHIPYFNRKKTKPEPSNLQQSKPGTWLEVTDAQPPTPKPKPIREPNPILQLETPDFNHIAHEAKAKRLKERLAKAELNKIPDPLLYLPASWVKSHKLKGKKQPKPKPTKSTDPVIQKPPKPKGPSIRERLTSIADSPWIPKLVVTGITLTSFMVVAVFIVLATGIPLLLLAPQWFVGTVEEAAIAPIPPVTLEPAINETGWSPTPYRVPVEAIEYRPIPKSTDPKVPTPVTPPPIQYPSEVVPVLPTPTLPVVSVTNTTKTFLIGGKERDPNSIPTMYRWQYTFPCYWELRDLGYGKELSVEYACNSQDTGLWIKACECCKLMGKC
jgi:hypothetical protein